MRRPTGRRMTTEGEMIAGAFVMLLRVVPFTGRARHTSPHRSRLPPSRAALMMLCGLAALLLAACGSSGPNDPTAEPESTTSGPTARVITLPDGTPGAAPDGGPVPTGVSGNGQLISDPFCQARIPAGWVGGGASPGTTAGGHTFSLFGGRLAGPESWERAVELLRGQTANRADAEISEGEGFIRVTFAGGAGGLIHRARFEDRYCDFRVQARGAISEAERASWEPIVASLAPNE